MGAIIKDSPEPKSDFDGRNISFWNRLLGRVFCPRCTKKMKEIDWPYELGWQCACGWITWYESKK